MFPAPGPLNLITDVEGLSVGQAEDLDALTGVTVVLPEPSAVAAVDVRGGAPGTRETDALDPASLVERVDGIVLSGGSVFGLDAAGAVVKWLSGRGRGFAFAGQPFPCPVVPSAILFDLMNGGDKGWENPSYATLAVAACEAAGCEFRLGNAGAGAGATAGIFKGGLGSASIVWEGLTVGALVAVNGFGSPADPSRGRLWAHAHLEERDGIPRDVAVTPAPGRSPLRWSKAEARLQTAGGNTTIAVVATDADLSRVEASRLAIMTADGMARALDPVHTPFDGDTVFALATGRRALPEPRPLNLASLGALAAQTLARAIARAVWEASGIPGWPGYREGMSRQA